MSSNYPLVSLIITSYNRASLISKAIESSLEQDYPNLEIIISDNCSTDNTEAVVKKYLIDPRIKYFRNGENLGMLGNFRKATYEYSKGEYITYVNSDDYLTDNSFVSDCIKLVNRDKDILLVHGRMAFNNTISGVLWEMPEDPYFLKEIWDGRDVFFESMKTGLMSWGACFMKWEAMYNVKSLQSDYHNFDFDSDYKIMLSAKVGFINRLCYMQMGHDDNAGFPADAKKIVQSLECFENVAAYAITKMPDKAAEVEKWKQHFILFTISWGFHSLKEKNKEQYKLFKNEVREIYPDLYRKFINSWKYKKLVILHPIKRILPGNLIGVFRNFKKKFSKNKWS